MLSQEEGQPLCKKSERRDQMDELDQSRRKGEYTSSINTERRTKRQRAGEDSIHKSQILHIYLLYKS